MSRSNKSCERCGCRFISAERKMAWRGGCGVCVRSDRLSAYCVDCADRELELAGLHENMRRLEGWAEKEGTRTKLATALVKEIDSRGLDTRRRQHVVWALVWEMTGSRKELRKLVERLMQAWGKEVHVIDPVMGETAERLKNRQAYRTDLGRT